MPLTPIDYSKCVIYKIVCIDPSVDEIYVGHTTDFKSRKRQHKKSCYNEHSKSYNFKLYQYIRANNGWDKFVMCPIEEYPCENSTQACIREEAVRLELKAQLNSRKAYISEQERKQQSIKNANQYCQINRERITEYQKQYHQENKEQLKEYRKQYRDEHKEELVEKSKQYREKHKEEIAARKKQQHICECGIIFTNCHKARHERSKKHQDFLNTKA